MLLDLRSLYLPGQVFTYTSQGGIVFGGQATFQQTYTFAASGGLTFGGTAPLKLVKVYQAPAAGITFSGTATVQQVYAFQAAGGIVFGGTATERSIFVFSPTGGVTFGGNASLAQVKVFQPAAAGIIFGGQAALKTTNAFLGTGGLVFGGTAQETRIYAYGGQGGITFGGDGSPVFVPGGTFSYTGQGGIAFGGSADMVLELIPVIGPGILPPFKAPPPPRHPVKQIPPVPALAHPAIYVVPPSFAGVAFGGAAAVAFYSVAVRRQILDVEPQPADNLVAPDEPALVAQPAEPDQVVVPVTRQFAEDEDELLLLDVL